MCAKIAHSLDKSKSHATKKHTKRAPRLAQPGALPL